MIEIEQKGYIYNIQRASFDDGPGIRTVLFLKGCPIRCPWCHNPESQNGLPELLVYTQKCNHCGGCTAKCPVQAIDAGIVDRNRCTVCGECVKSCPRGALAITGKCYTVSQAVAEAIKDRSFFETSGGGVTLSGGEPLIQANFTLELVKALKQENIHTCIETCGICDDGVIESLVPFVDHWLYDVKLTDQKLHQTLLGVPLTDVYKGLSILTQSNATITLRCPIIPDVNDNPEHFAAIRELASEVKAVSVDILPYHRLGIDKYAQIGRTSPPNYDVPEAKTIESWEKAVAFEK